MKKLIVTFCCALCIAVCAFGQDQARSIAFVHENAVKPSMSAEYRASIKKLKDACTLHKIKMTWRTIVFEDNSFAHIFPIPGLAAIEKNLFTDLEGKVGKEAMRAMIADVEKCIDSQTQSVVTAMPEVSYLDPAPDDNYRLILFIVPIPGKEEELEKHFGDWKAAYQAKKSLENFHVYRSTFGAEPGYLISLSAKNPTDMQQKMNKSHAQVGEDTGKLWNKQTSLTKRFYWKRGWIAGDLSYHYTGIN